MPGPISMLVHLPGLAFSTNHTFNSKRLQQRYPSWRRKGSGDAKPGRLSLTRMLGLESGILRQKLGVWSKVRNGTWHMQVFQPERSQVYCHCAWLEGQSDTCNVTASCSQFVLLAKLDSAASAVVACCCCCCSCSRRFPRTRGIAASSYGTRAHPFLAPAFSAFTIKKPLIQRCLSSQMMCCCVLRRDA